MNAAEILVAVRNAGATLRVEGDSLVASNASRIAPAIKAAIREHKPQIIAALGRPACVVCNAPDDVWTLDTPAGPVLVHQESARLLPKREPAEPTAAYHAASADPDGAGCKIEIIDLPQAQRYRKVFGHLQLKPPALVPVGRWQRAIQDGSSFLAKWGEQAQALGWSSAALFGLHTPPDKPHPSYSRLSRYDCTGLIWLLEGRPVVALTADTASIRNLKTGNVTVYRKHNKPALGPRGDSLDDFARNSSLCITH